MEFWSGIGTEVEYWSVQTDFLDANIANQDTHKV